MVCITLNSLLHSVVQEQHLTNISILKWEGIIKKKKKNTSSWDITQKSMENRIHACSKGLIRIYVDSDDL